MPKVIALIPTDLDRTRLGLRSRVTEEVRGLTVLERTVARIMRVPSVEAVVLVHPAGQSPEQSLSRNRLPKPMFSFADPGHLTDPHHAMRIAARKWALGSWRGGLGGATCYDELLPAGPLAAALEAYGGESAILVGADWLLVDPQLSARVLDPHLAHADVMQMTFCQAPPGLAGIALGRGLLRQLADKHATIGQLFAYVPTRPQADPIGKDVCVQIDPAVRSCARRFIYDTPGSIALIDALDPEVLESDASAAVLACHESTSPREFTVELTPRRTVRGPITPQHHVAINRPDMDADAAVTLMNQIGKLGDAVVTFGGLGDALLHPAWDRIVQAAHDAGVFGIAVETDLLVDEATLGKLLTTPIDVVTVRLNADTAAVYEAAMGADRFKDVVGNLQWLLSERAKRDAETRREHDAETRGHGDAETPIPASPRPRVPASSSPGLPWIVPRLIKTTETLKDLETFYDRWVHFAGHAVIEPARSGCGLMPDQSPVRMAPPRRGPCRQIERRLTVLSNGSAAQCDQDWLGRSACGNMPETSIEAAWSAMQEARTAHREGRGHELALCGSCDQWHRP